MREYIRGTCSRTMRHGSLTTTETFYLRDQARDVADRINAKLGVCDRSQVAAKGPARRRRKSS